LRIKWIGLIGADIMGSGFRKGGGKGVEGLASGPLRDLMTGLETSRYSKDSKSEAIWVLKLDGIDENFS
jgi:hypothetical protein